MPVRLSRHGETPGYDPCAEVDAPPDRSGRERSGLLAWPTHVRTGRCHITPGKTGRSRPRAAEGGTGPAGDARLGGDTHPEACPAPVRKGDPPEHSPGGPESGFQPPGHTRGLALRAGRGLVTAVLRGECGGKVPMPRLEGSRTVGGWIYGGAERAVAVPLERRSRTRPCGAGRCGPRRLSPARVAPEFERRGTPGAFFRRGRFVERRPAPSDRLAAALGHPVVLRSGGSRGRVGRRRRCGRGVEPTGCPVSSWRRTLRTGHPAGPVGPR
ncbi:hypothetical protein SAMN05421505_103132 [Sinosporangium album]|uniref:Uncharacterized protein n=1 Tax=Sinosporangium album TaxID=504805 RepID=A0A1G7T6N4_9ACTN|nr:hypothetical protein SAMN05421505_103132 [Sinosporangium album]